MDLFSFQDQALGHLHSNTAVILIDAVSLLLLLGLISCTYVFRKRGRLSDRLFFIMIILNMVMADLMPSLTFVPHAGSEMSG